MIKFKKTVIALALLIAAGSTAKYLLDANLESFQLAFRDYAYKADHVEDKYKGYYGYRYYLWLEEIVPADQGYALLTAPESNKLYDRYLHRLNYFLYPKRVLTKDPRYLFAPKLSGIAGVAGEKGGRVALYRNRAYRLIATKDDAGIFKRQ